ncbi:CBS domain-containing protein [Sphaerisporangium sp. NPDC051017]|uniref:CBS domain-containing protein n=1 Tax=Sphaerisporangium sp. NPDC051017 TaxID=3154636 RepID=UPI00341D01EE
MRKKVRDVMTRKVASVNGSTPFRDVAEVLIHHGVSAVPVVDGEGHVLGMISEADLLRKEEFKRQYYHEGYRPPLSARLREQLARRGRGPEDRARGDVAAELMTSPAITVKDHASLVTAARQMSANGVKRLPVVDDEGRLEGIVSRHDLLTVFLRSDEEIAGEIRDDVVGALWPYMPEVDVSVDDGVVTLSGRMATAGDARLLAQMAERVNGVIDVIDELEWPTSAARA